MQAPATRQSFMEVPPRIAALLPKMSEWAARQDSKRLTHEIDRVMRFWPWLSVEQIAGVTAMKAELRARKTTGRKKKESV